MKDMIKLIGVLVVICAVAGSLLALVHKVTAEPIRETEKRVRNKAMEEVLPAYDNDPVSDAVPVQGSDKEWVFHIAKKDGNYVGAAFEASSSKGYGGEIVIMVGINADDSVQALKILKQKETPGLGAKINDPEWRNQFAGKSLTDTNWRVKKDQGDIDQITAATISSRAVTEAVKSGIDIYLANKEAITGASGE